jgi:hypothetical protein
LRYKNTTSLQQSSTTAEMFARVAKTIGNNNKILFQSFSKQQQRNLTTAPFDTYEGGKKGKFLLGVCILLFIDCIV